MDFETAREMQDMLASLRKETEAFSRRNRFVCKAKRAQSRIDYLALRLTLMVEQTTVHGNIRKMYCSKMRIDSVCFNRTETQVAVHLVLSRLMF